MRALAAVWPDGVVTVGRNPSDLLDRIGSLQWDRPVDRAEVKRVLSDRAWTWSAVAVDPLLPDAEFVIALADADLFRIEWRPQP